MSRILSWIVAMNVVASLAFGVEPFRLVWMNHPVEETEYRSEAHPEGVFVIHVYFYNCSYNHILEPQVNELAAYYASEPRVQVLDVGIDKQKSFYEKWIQKHKPNHPVLNDGARSLVSQLPDPLPVPMTYILDEDGNIRYQARGPWSQKQSAEIHLTIEELLSERARSGLGR